VEDTLPLPPPPPDDDDEVLLPTTELEVTIGDIVSIQDGALKKTQLFVLAVLDRKHQDTWLVCRRYNAVLLSSFFSSRSLFFCLLSSS
jgi:hypothetical protein